MPRLDIVDIMHDNVFRGSFQQSIIDDDAVILFGQLYKIAIDNTVERILIAPEYFGVTNLFQPTGTAFAFSFAAAI
mgnify:CR=1 FL=1